MGGCCCFCAPKTTELHGSPPFFHVVQYPAYEEHLPLSSQPATVSTGFLVDTNLDTSAPDTYHPPPAPLPYETHVGHPPTPSLSQESTGNKSRVVLPTANNKHVVGTDGGSTLETKVKNSEFDEKEEINIEMTAKEVEDEKSDDLKKPSEPFIPPLECEEDVCPTCLEEYDLENPKMITKCDHHFHFACILEWMERSNTCPVCNQEMVFSPAIGG